MFTGIFNLTRD